MRVAFLHARQDPKYARWMLAAVREAMPGAEAVQLTDADTPALPGCEVVRKEWAHPNPMIFRMEHLSELRGEALVIDTDVVVQVDFAPLFSFPFDVGLTWRDGPIWDPEGNDITKAMPFNCGVMLHRSREFWQACLAWCVGRKLGWYADQLAVAAVAKRFHVLKLHCENFNHKPRAGEDVSMRCAVHYKGGARALMDRRFE